MKQPKTNEYQNINVRIPAEVVASIDQAAEAESQRTGLRVDRSQIVRRVLVREVAKMGRGKK